MDKTISRYEHDREMLKFSLYDEEDERILYVSLSCNQQSREEFGLELMIVNQTMEDFIDSKIIDIKHYDFTRTQSLDESYKSFRNAFYDTFNSNSSEFDNDKYFKCVGDCWKYYDTASYIVSVKTTQGSFLIFAYNEHSGYYCHDVNIEYDDVNILDSL
jgi:hypothetical protein